MTTATIAVIVATASASIAAASPMTSAASSTARSTACRTSSTTTTAAAAAKAGTGYDRAANTYDGNASERGGGYGRSSYEPRAYDQDESRQRRGRDDDRFGKSDRGALFGGGQSTSYGRGRDEGDYRNQYGRGGGESGGFGRGDYGSQGQGYPAPGPRRERSGRPLHSVQLWPDRRRFVPRQPAVVGRRGTTAAEARTARAAATRARAAIAIAR